MSINVFNTINNSLDRHKDFFTKDAVIEILQEKLSPILKKEFNMLQASDFVWLEDTDNEIKKVINISYYHKKAHANISYGYFISYVPLVLTNYYKEINFKYLTNNKKINSTISTYNPVLPHMELSNPINFELSKDYMLYFSSGMYKYFDNAILVSLKDIHSFYNATAKTEDLISVLKNYKNERQDYSKKVSREIYISCGDMVGDYIEYLLIFIYCKNNQFNLAKQAFNEWQVYKPGVTSFEMKNKEQNIAALALHIKEKFNVDLQS